MISLRKFLLGLAASTALLLAGGAAAQTAKVVTTCGTVSPTYTAGQFGYPTIDVNGNTCSSASGGGGGGAVFGPTARGSAAANPPVLIGGTADGSATGAVGVEKVDSAGNASVNEAQIAGTATSVGNGLTDAGTERVSLSSDSTGQVKLATGANTIGAISNSSFALSAGAAVIGHVIVDTAPSTAVTNAGTFATQDTQAGTWTVQPGNTANTTPWLVSALPATSGGLSTFVLEPAASDNHTNIKNGAGQVYHLAVWNNSATINYVRLYNAGTGFNGCNSATNLVWEGHIPANTNDAGFVEDIAAGLAFSTGISLCVTGAYGQTSTTAATASAISLNVGYK